MRFQRLIFIAAAFFMCGSLAVLGAGLYQQYMRPSPAILAACAHVGRADEAYDSCLRTAAHSLLSAYSTGELLGYITATSSPAIVQNNCHDIAHAIGEETFLKYNATEGAFAECTNVCSNGCFHGVLAQSIANQLGFETLGEDLVHTDMSTVLSVGKANCSKSSVLCHAVGHIFYIGENDIQRALDHCDAVDASATSTEACYQGVFMEAAGEDAGGGATFDRKAISEVSTYAYDYPCASLVPKYQHDCFMYLPEFQRAAMEKKGIPGSQWFEASSSQCEKYVGDKRTMCFNGVGYFIGRSDWSNANGANACARLLNAADKKACTDGMAERYAARGNFETTIQFCASLSDIASKTSCYGTAFDLAEYQKIPASTGIGLCTPADRALCRQVSLTRSMQYTVPAVPLQK